MSEEAGSRLIDLDAVETDDGPALARLVSRLRSLAEREGSVVLVNCPQMLAHTLFKSGVLGAGRIHVASWRQEEPYG